MSRARLPSKGVTSERNVVDPKEKNQRNWLSRAWGDEINNGISNLGVSW